MNERVHSLRLAALAIGAAAVAATVAAQSPSAPDSALEARLAAVGRIRVGNEIRVLLDNGAKLGGRYSGVRGEALLLRLPPPSRPMPGLLPDTVPYEVPVAAVDSLWERRRIGPAAPVVLAGAGAIAGYLVVWAERSSEEGECDYQCSQASLDGGIIGAVLGFAAGVVLGYIVPLWWERFP